MEHLVQILVVGLAAWRASAMLVMEDGPFSIFRRVRLRAGLERPGEVSGFWGLLLVCVWCTSVWMAILFWALWYVHWAIPGIFAAAATAIVVDRARQ